MKLNLFLKPETLKIIGELGTLAPELRKKKAEIRERLRTERQCTETTKTNARCKNWAVYGDDSGKCRRHGGTADKSSCDCPAYPFPHRRRGGLCNFPNEPHGISETAKGKRRHYKRMRKARVKNWLKGIGY